MHHAPSDIAATLLAQSGVGGAIGWSLTIIVVLIVAFFALVRLRRWIKDDDDDDGAGGGGIGFGLSDIRRLHREGKMTDEEFERLRSMFVAGAKSMAEKMPDPLARSGQPPPPPRDQRRQPPPPNA